MATRKRMFSDAILCGGKFMSLSTEAKLLYIYMQLLADDDGIVDASIVLRILGESFEKYIRNLLDAEFILSVVEEDQIYYCTWFRSQNTIRAKYKTPSMYWPQFSRKHPELADINSQPKRKKQNEQGKTENISSLTPNKKNNEKKYCGVPEDTWARFDR